MNEPQHSDENIHDSTLSSLYQKTKLEQPSMALDSAILRQARSAVQKKTPWWYLHGMIPVASTAIILLVVAVSWQNRDSQIMVSDMPMASIQKPKQVADQTQSLQTFSSQNEEKADVAAMPSPPPHISSSAEGIKSAQPHAASQVSKQKERVLKRKLQTSSSFAANQAEEELAFDSFADAATSTQKEIIPPEKQLKEIEALLEQRKYKQATEALKAFLEQFPDYEVPEQLQQKLEAAAMK